MAMNAIARVPYFSLFKLKMIQSPDRGLTRTRIIRLRSATPHDSIPEVLPFPRTKKWKYKGDYRLFSYRQGR